MRPAGDPEDLARGQQPSSPRRCPRARPPRARSSLRRQAAKSFCSGICRVSRSRSRKSRRRRPAGEPDRVDLHEVGQRRVEQPEPAVLVEDREPDRQVREGLGQRLDEAAQRGLGGDEVVGVEREAEASRRPAPGVSLTSNQCASPSCGPGTATRRRRAAAARGQRHLLEHVAEGVGDAVVGQFARRRRRSGRGRRRWPRPPGRRAPRLQASTGARSSASRRKRASVAGARQRGLGVAQRARLLARRADRQEGARRRAARR